jgi:hypothetical protein
VPLPSRWSASAAIDNARRIGACGDIRWSGQVWRIHSSRFPADSYGGSLYNTGRFHRGRDLYPEDQCWPVLYLSLDGHASQGEYVRHFLPPIPAHLGQSAAQAVTDTLRDLFASDPPLSSEQIIEQLAQHIGQTVAEDAVAELSAIKNRALSTLAVDLSKVLDCSDVTALGLNPPGVLPADLYSDSPDYQTGQALASEVRARGYEAIIVPSASGYGNNLIVFPNKCLPASRIEPFTTHLLHMAPFDPYRSS